MTRISRGVTIAAPPAEVWAVVADLESVAGWNPGVTSARCGPTAAGVGATRTCRLRPAGSIDEVVSIWEPERELWFAVGRHGAIRSADMGLVLTPVAPPERAERVVVATSVEAVADYHLAFGPLGPVIDHLTIRRMLVTALDNALDGLKHHLENPSPTPTREPNPTPAPSAPRK